MSDDVALIIPITADPNPFKQAMNGIQNSVSASMEGVKNSLANVKASFGAVGLMAADYLKGAVESATKAQKANANLEQTIISTGDACGMTAKQVEDMAGGLSKVSLFGGSAIKSGEAMLLTFTNIGKDVLPMASQAMLDLSQKMGTDPQQTAIQLGKALNDPVKGISALQRVGVTFDASQKAVIASMVKTGDVAGAQKIILGELSKEFGGQALAATKTYDGQLQMMKKSLDGVKTSIGMAVLPYLQQMAEKIQSIITPIADFLQKNSKLTAVILSLTAALGTLIGGASLFSKVSGLLGPIVSGLSTVLAGMAAPILAIIAVIALLGVAYATNFGGIKDVIDNFINTSMKFLTDVFNDLKNWIITNLPVIEDKFKTIFASIKTILGVVVDFLAAVFLPLFKGILQWFTDNWPEIKNTFEAVFGKVIEIATALYNYFQDNILPIIMDLVKTVQDNMPMIQDIFQNVWDIIGNVLEIAWAIIKKVWDIMVDLYNFISPTFPLIGAIIKVAFEVVVGAVKVVIDIFLVLTDAITTAVNWLTHWNNTPAKNKTATVDVTHNDTADGMDVGRNAEGTDSWRGGLTWVGEKGPELVNLARGAQVIPNNKINTGSVTNKIDALMKVDKLVISNDMDIRDLAQKLEFYRVQVATAKGGA